MFFLVRLIGNVMVSLVGRMMIWGVWVYVDVVDVKGEESYGRLVRNWEIDL